ncbi:MAG: hypothetical protein Q9191_005773 [Dirinaria sp. TL-2023a]
MDILRRSVITVASIALTASSVAARPCKSFVFRNSSAPTPQVSTTQASTKLCGNNDHKTLDGTPWLIANSMYGAAQMVGSVCTDLDKIQTAAGNICFDFILGSAKGDSTSTAAQELMLWLQYEGGQLPIGWDRGPAATIDSLFGTSWKLYEDVNHSSGMTVHSMLPNTQFDGSFAGDLKEWFEALVKLGRFTDATYVNIGNAG